MASVYAAMDDSSPRGGRRLGIAAVVCALLAFPVFQIGGRVGDSVGYDAGAEIAFGGAAVAGILAILLGAAAGFQAVGGRGGGAIALMSIAVALVLNLLAFAVAAVLVVAVVIGKV
jgi:hypothetical protein